MPTQGREASTRPHPMQRQPSITSMLSIQVARSSIGLHRRRGAIALAFGKKVAVVPGDADLQTLGDPSCAPNEVIGRLGGADFPRRLLKESEPLIEVLSIDRQPEVP